MVKWFYDRLVRRGAALLDADRIRVDAHWRERIDIQTLDMSSNHHCVLAQVFRSFYLAPLHLQMNNAFDLDSLWTVLVHNFHFRQLTEAWTRYLSTD